MIIQIRYGLAAGALALGVALSAPVGAATVTDLITFTDTGSNCITGDCTGHYDNTTVSGSFDITFDPTVQILPSESISGVITNLSVTVTDPYFSSSPLTLNSITSFAFDGAGTLTLSSLTSLSKTFTNSPDITIGINGWAYGVASDVWYSQADFPGTLTSSGSATITPQTEHELTATPLPSTWAMMLAGLGGPGLLCQSRDEQDLCAHRCRLSKYLIGFGKNAAASKGCHRVVRIDMKSHKLITGLAASVAALFLIAFGSPAHAITIFSDF